MIAKPSIALLVAALSGSAWCSGLSLASVSTENIQGAGLSGTPAISADGRFVAFVSSAANLVPNDTNGKADVFVRDLLLGTTEIVSISTDGTQGNDDASYPAISADGRIVAFTSRANNLVPNDTNGWWDIFVRDRQTGITERVSVSSTGEQANHFSFQPSLSADGNLVCFVSPASNLVTGDTNGVKDIFVRDRQLGTTERVSVSSSGEEADRQTTIGVISADGSCVAMVSYATNLAPGDTGLYSDLFLHDRGTGETIELTAGGDGPTFDCSISASGRFVAFVSDASNLVPNDTNGVKDVFVYDAATGMTDRISVSTDGAELNGDSTSGTLSADGRFVGFWSGSTNAVPGDINGHLDCFVRDRMLGTTTCVSAGGNADSYEPVFSADGSRLAFQSLASNLVAGDTNGDWDVFVMQLPTATVSGSVDFGVANPPTSVNMRLSWSGWDEPFMVAPTALNGQGEFTIATPSGPLDLSIKPNHWLRRTLAADTTSGNASGLFFELANGDAEEDNAIDLLDLNRILTEFGSVDNEADLDGSGQIDLPDLNIVFLNFGMAGDS